ncbi:hypothetical protein GCM10020220_035580 [Nonomuraea rubra]|uniref:hypothetical protein n=1 Tax=Nonomuraea rubra TaxID=46180 RepID=UPI0031EAC6ED
MPCAPAPGVLAPGRLCGVLALARLYAGERWHRAAAGTAGRGCVEPVRKPGVRGGQTCWSGWVAAPGANGSVCGGCRRGPGR